MLYDLKSLKKNLGGRTILDLSLGLRKGAVVGLIGPNGAGKTTLLELLSFLSTPTSGEIWYQSRKVDLSGAGGIRLRRSVVLVQQNPVLFTTSVHRNVAFPLKIRGVDKRKRKGVAHDLLHLVGMDGFSRTGAHRLSGGETQRVAIAQALACSPEVILLDEPTASVDIENQIIIEGIIRDLNRKEGISVIFTTHNTSQASRLSDEVVFLHEGRIAEYPIENFFSGDIGKDPGGRTVCLIGSGVAIPVTTEKKGRVRIAVDPRAAQIALTDSENDPGIPIQGRLVQLTHEKDGLRAKVHIGVPLSILVPLDQVSDIPMRIGKEVWVRVTPEKVVVF